MAFTVAAEAGSSRADRCRTSGRVSAATSRAIWQRSARTRPKELQLEDPTAERVPRAKESMRLLRCRAIALTLSAATKNATTTTTRRRGPGWDLSSVHACRWVCRRIVRMVQRRSQRWMLLQRTVVGPSPRRRRADGRLSCQLQNRHRRPLLTWKKRLLSRPPTRPESGSPNHQLSWMQCWPMTAGAGTLWLLPAAAATAPDL